MHIYFKNINYILTVSLSKARNYKRKHSEMRTSYGAILSYYLRLWDRDIHFLISVANILKLINAHPALQVLIL